MSHRVCQVGYATKETFTGRAGWMQTGCKRRVNSSTITYPCCMTSSYLHAINLADL